MANDFEISNDWGDNGANDLHSSLFDNKEQRICNANEQLKLTKKRKKSNKKNVDSNKSVETLPMEEIKTKKERKKYDKESGKIDKKGEKRKAVEDSKSVKNKKKKILENKKETLKTDRNDVSTPSLNSKSKDYNERHMKTSVTNKLTEVSEMTETDKTKQKKKGKKKALNKFKTEEFLNSKKLCGRFVDLTTKPHKIIKHKKDSVKENLIAQEITEEKNVGKDLKELKKKRKKYKKGEDVIQAKTEELKMTSENLQETMQNKVKPIDLRTKMEKKLKGARFRFINEKLYTCTGETAMELFSEDNEAFQVYHDGFVEQVKSWPVNPVDKIIEDLKKMPSSKIVADFGCGDAKIANSVKQKVHSFDLVSVKDCVIACNMANVTLADKEIDVAVFCLSLMGTNWIDYLKEANRVLKNKGLLKIAEVSSRFQNLKAFILAMKRLGFSQLNKDTSNKFFISLDFKKQGVPKDISEGMNEILKPCLYKKR